MVNGPHFICSLISGHCCLYRSSAIHPKSIAHGNHTIVHSELSTSSNVYIKEKHLPSFRQIQGGWMVMYESTNTKQVQRLSALFRTTEMASSFCSVGTVHLVVSWVAILGIAKFRHIVEFAILSVLIGALSGLLQPLSLAQNAVIAEGGQ